MPDKEHRAGSGASTLSLKLRRACAGTGLVEMLVSQHLPSSRMVACIMQEVRYHDASVCTAGLNEPRIAKEIGMTVKLYGLDGSPNVRGAMLGLAEKGVEYDLVPVMPPFKDAEHLARNPLGRVPAMEHDDFTLYETTAIVRYVDRVFSGPALQPSDAREVARMDQILSIVDSYVARTWSGAIGFERLLATPFFGRPADVAQIEAALPLARSCVEALEVLISEPYLTGETFSLADIRLMPHFHWLGQTPEGEEILAGRPKLAQWFARVSERPTARTVLQPV